MSLSLAAKIESMLFVASQPLSVRQLAKLVKSDEVAVDDALLTLGKKYEEEGGLMILRRGADVTLSTKAEVGPLVGAFLKEQVQGELTRPQLETLTIIAYRGPVTKAELELIRGVNCSLIVRNLLIRGLIEERQDPIMHTEVYDPSFEFLRHLGVQSVAELPQYSELHQHADLEAVLQSTESL